MKLDDVTAAFQQGRWLGYENGRKMTREGLSQHWNELERAKEEIRDARRWPVFRSWRALCLGYIRGLREAIDEYEKGNPDEGKRS